MSSTTVERPVRMGIVNKKENENNTKSRRVSIASQKKHKHEDSKHFKFGRKRLQSFTNNGKFYPPHKRRKKEGAIIPPTKFLLGGNICDPLNLNSMQDEEVNRAMNAVTPKSSPLPTPKHRKGTIEVIIPPNICDPLNLTNCSDDAEYEKQLISPLKKTSKKRNRKRKRASSPGKDDSTETVDAKEPMHVEEAKIAEAATAKAESEPQIIITPAKSPVEEPQPEPQQSKTDLESNDKVKLRLKGLEEPKDKRIRKIDLKDKIVSPVIPQPGAWKPRPPHRQNSDKRKRPHQEPKFNSKNARFQYGNYNRYYGYRNPHQEEDTRLRVFRQRKELFAGKDVLDIGCNIGHITLSVARDFSVRSITGIDIDKKLIGIARKNVKHYVNNVQFPLNSDNSECKDSNCFPMSMLINYGPVDVPGFTKHNDQKGFPYNVTFIQGNYVVEDDSLLSLEHSQFDTILCLSTTKWIHLNFGDAGLKQSFKRMHAQLRPGGVLVLEVQPWSGYKRRKALTEKIYKNYQSIELKPHHFVQYLLSPEVGFSKCELVSTPSHPSKGFQRPLHLFTKADTAATTPAATSTATPNLENPEVVVLRNERRLSREQQEQMRMEYERELFPSPPEPRKESWTPGTSQRSGESLSQYELLHNVYAPSATPCYDTPVHNTDSLPPDPNQMCYLDVNIEHDNRASPIPEVSQSAESHPEALKIENPELKSPEVDVMQRLENTPDDTVSEDNTEYKCEIGTRDEQKLIGDEQQQIDEIREDDTLSSEFTKDKT
ncbi:hypothetical protein QAD02_018887 [Eretmocerus hayati]|uniref:Uncharacterized protein n=1 Tax=Eretmocerus hayati TaxID=131215 RepID=A0ACC2PHM6_9HYME|nr:hypothetical protein QAD02_018887 [Eretmocerus hayati]